METSGYVPTPSAEEVDLKVTWSSNGILLKWNPIDPAYLATGSKLVIMRLGLMNEWPGHNSLFLDLSLTATEFLDVNVDQGYFYRYSLGLWKGDYSEQIAGNRGFTYGGGLPKIPSDVGVKLFDASVKITWTFPEWFIGGGEFEFFELYRSDNGSIPTLVHKMDYVEASWNNSFYYDNDVICDRTYAYTIRAVSTMGMGTTSSPVVARPGRAPQNISISPLNAGVSEEVNATISWNMPSDDLGIIGYSIYANGRMVYLDNHTFSCSSTDFGFGSCIVTSVYDDGRIVFGNEIAVSRPMGACLGGYEIQYLIMILGAISFLVIAIILIYRKQKNRK